MGGTFGMTGGIGENAILDAALTTARYAESDLNNILKDVEHDGTLNNTTSTDGDNGLLVAQNYGYNTDGAAIDISTASGAMVVDDLMQKISTKVQSASQMLSAANNIDKTASRILSQG